MQDAHDLHEASSQAGEFRDKQNIIFFHFDKKGAQFPLGEFAGAAHGFFNPAVNVQLLFIRVFEDFKALVVGGLFVG